MKLDKYGNKLWEYTDATLPNDDSCNSVAIGNDGSYVALCTTDKGGANGIDLLVLKLDPASGNPVMQATFGGPGEESAGIIKKTSDGGYIIGATSTTFSATQDAYIIKVDADLNSQWDKVYGGSGGEEALASIEQTSDGGYIVGINQTPSSGFGQVWILKLNSSGDCTAPSCP